MEERILMMKKRDSQGSSEARRMRRDGWIPGVIYTEGREARSIAVPSHEFQELLHHHAGESMMVDIQIEGEKPESVLLKTVQHDALGSTILHIDFQEVAQDKVLRVEIQIELKGEPVGVKDEGGVLEHLQHKIEVECLPADLMESLEVDVSEMALGDTLCVKDIVIDSSKYTLLMDEDVSIASVSMPRVEEEPEPEEGEEGAEGEEASTEPEVIGEKKEETGE